MMWSPSKAIDFLSENTEGEATSNILLVCPNDVSSILKTISNAITRNPSKEIRFYTVEEHADALARHFMLLHTFFDQSLPIRQRAMTYLDLFGNAAITEKDAKYMAQKAIELVDLVLDDKQLTCLENVFDLSLLKQRDRDDLADIFESWRKPSSSDSNITRDELLRQYYGARYDSRIGVVDWDYQMYLKPSASIIHPRQFREWRLSGQAFEFGGSSSNFYTMPNKTLPKSRVDVVNGPFISLGIDCDRSDELADKLFDVHHKSTGAEQHMHSATDVALYNVTSFMWAVTVGQKYRMTIKGDVFSGLGTDAPDEDVDLMQPNSSSPKKRFSFVPISSRKPLLRKQFSKFFDTVFISNAATSILEDDRFFGLLKVDATLLVEIQFGLAKNDSYKTKLIADLRGILSRTSAVEMSCVECDADDDVLRFRQP